MSPENSEEFINYLVSVGRLEEAAERLAGIINQDDFVSKEGKSKHQVSGWKLFVSPMDAAFPGFT